MNIATGIAMLVGAWIAGYLWSSLASFWKNFWNGS
jgi:hypothetical protein